MKILFCICPPSVFNGMTYKSKTAVLFGNEFQESTIEVMSDKIGKDCVLSFLRYVSSRDLASISRIQTGKGVSQFAIIVHYGMMNKGNQTASIFLFEKEENKLFFPYSKTFLQLKSKTYSLNLFQREKQKTNAKSKPSIYDSFVLSCLRQQKANHPKRTINTSDKAVAAGSKTISQLIKIDGFSFEEIQKVVTWAIMDSFWTDNIYSLSQLRKVSKANGNTKFENMRNSYLTKKPELEEEKGEFSEVKKRTCTV